jgi:DNA replication protein DnaC
VAAMNEYIPTLDKVTLPGKYIPQDVSFEFLPSSEFFLTLKASFSHDTGEIEVLSKFAGVKILLLDDIGSEKVSDWSKQMFYALIDRRYRNMAQTVITSNLTLQQLSETIDDRIASRISEMCLVVELKGNDFRLKQS